MAKITDGEIKQAALELVRSTKKYFKEVRMQQAYEAMWKQAEDIYFAQSSRDIFTAGQLFKEVERIVPKMDISIFPPDGEFFEARTRHKQDDFMVEAAEKATNLLKQQFINASLRNLFIPSYRSLGIYGTTFFRYYWDRREKKVFKREFKGVERIRKPEFITQYDDPMVEEVSIWDIYIDPKDEFLQGALIHETIVEFSDLWQMRKRKDEDGELVGIYDTEEVKSLKNVSLSKTPDDDKEESEELRGLRSDKFAPFSHKLIVDHYWGPVPKYFFTKRTEDKDSEELVENAYIVVAGAGEQFALLSMKENPFDHQNKPYLKACYIKVSGRAYGIGIINPITIHLSNAYDVTMKQGIDNRSFALRNKWLVDKTAGVDLDQLQDIDNVVIEANDINALKDLRPPDMTATIANHLAILKNDIDEVTGALPFLSGIPAGRSLERTAEGVATLTNAGLERFILIITSFEQDVLIPLAIGFWQLNQQFLPEGRDVELIGERIVRVIPEDIQASDLDFIFVGIREIADKNFKVQALNILIQNLAPFIEAGQIDPKPILYRFIRLLGQSDLIDEIDISQESQLESTPEGEVELLKAGRKVKVDLDEDQEPFITAYQKLLQLPDLPQNVRQNTEDALRRRMSILKIQEIITQRESEIGQS